MLSPEENEALEAQQELLENSLSLVFEAFDSAIKEKMVDPVILLLDCEDAIGSEIARSWLGDEAVDNAIEERQLDEEEIDDENTTVFAYAFPFAECRREIPAVFPYLSPVFEQPPPTDGFLAISVTSGGASALTVPPSARQ